MVNLTNHKDFEVSLINGEECKDFFYKWGLFASTCYNSDKRYANRIGKVCFNSGHNSGSRTFYFIFDIKNVPRSAVAQLIRHEQGVVKNVMSFRYVNMDNAKVYIPNLISKDEELKSLYAEVVEKSLDGYSKLVKALNEKGYTGEKANEQARGLLPMNTNTGLTIGFTYEALKHLANERLCVRAEFPIRMLVKQMVNEVIKFIPEFKDILVSKCVDSGYCSESKSCGLYNKKGEFTTEQVYKNILNGIPMKLPEWNDSYLISYNKKNIILENANITYSINDIFNLLITRGDWLLH